MYTVPMCARMYAVQCLTMNGTKASPDILRADHPKLMISLTIDCRLAALGYNKTHTLGTLTPSNN